MELAVLADRLTLPSFDSKTRPWPDLPQTP